jgi:hypothetical protein
LFVGELMSCLRIVVPNTYCFVFFLWFSSSCVPYILYVASFSGLSIFACPFRVLYSLFNLYKFNKRRGDIMQGKKKMSIIYIEVNLCPLVYFGS